MALPRAQARVSRFAALLALVSLLCGMPARALPLPEAPATLHIVILDGEDALNNIRDRTAREPIVEVEDENHRPVAGALVLFAIHSGTGGAGATAAGGLSSLSVTTGANGQAALSGFQINGVTGSYTITVTATLGALTAEATIHQTNGTASAPDSSTPRTETESAPARPAGSGGVLHHGKLLTVAAVAGAAAAIFFSLHAHATGISLGSGSVRP